MHTCVYVILYNRRVLQRLLPLLLRGRALALLLGAADRVRRIVPPNSNNTSNNADNSTITNA